ncbi:SDR family NAD(P)-dependent oxidoreductase [Paenibacillus chungangensis]|uniref:SDR family NAD(P)-dependent oxidoreductase n=1 Tax=Paenibacillus chungangensis TaxID=696535 RepID=A0ABW3HV73_9BACL
MLNGTIVWITGASSGIGAKTAALLAQRGAIPILTGRNEQKLREHTARIGERCSYYVMDVTDDRQVQATAEAIIERYGRIDILLNNAGYGEFLNFEDMPVERFQAMMETNYMGIVRCAKAALPYMQRQGGGHIVNIASMAGKFASAKSSAYSATKHAVLGLTNAMRMELRPQGIHVSAVNPGPIDTDFFSLADPEGHYVNNIKWFMMKPDYVALCIVRVMERKRAELDLPKAAGVGMKLYGLFPRLADRLFGGILNRK